jgi:hypothetical protein
MNRFVKLKLEFFSVNRWMDGVLGEAVINVAVNRNIVYRASFGNRFWEKCLKERVMSSITMDSIALKLDVSFESALHGHLVINLISF